MIAAREGALAVGTLERAVAGVLAVVPRQLVGSRELPGAAGPGTAVRLLPRVRPHVRLEVRRLAVRLRAAGVRARVRRRRSPATPGASRRHRGRRCRPGGAGPGEKVGAGLLMRTGRCGRPALDRWSSHGGGVWADVAGAASTAIAGRS